MVIDVLTIAKLSRWSIKYYNDTANAVHQAVKDAQKAGGGLGEYYTEHDTRTPVWLCAGDTHAAANLVGLTDIQRAGGEANTEVVARWLDEGVAPSGETGRAFGKRGVHGFDLTFCAPKTVSLIRALKADDVADKAILNAHTTAISEAMDYLAAHAGYTRVHNPVTGEKDFVKLQVSPRRAPSRANVAATVRANLSMIVWSSSSAAVSAASISAVPQLLICRRRELETTTAA